MNVPFAYELTVRTAAGDTVSRTYREVLTTDLCAVDRESFLPTLRIPGRDAYGEDVVREYRSGPKGFYEPMVHAYWNGGDREIRPLLIGDFDTAVTLHGQRNNVQLSTFINIPEVQRAAEVKLKGPPKPATVVYGDDGRTRVIRKVQAAVDRLLACDGEIHRSISEPILVMSRDKPAFSMRYMDSPDIDWHLAFRLDEAREARALAAEVFMTTPAQVEMPAFELLADDACRAKFPYAFGAAVLDLLHEAERALPDLPLTAMAAYCDLAESRHAPTSDEETQFASAIALISELEAAKACESCTRIVRFTLSRIAEAKGLGLSDDDRLALSL